MCARGCATTLSSLRLKGRCLMRCLQSSAATRWPSGAVHVDYDPTASSPEFEVRRPAGIGAVGKADQADLVRARELIGSATRPVVIVGAEAAADSEITKQIRRLPIPVLTTYQAIGTVPTTGDCAAGLFTNGMLEAPVLDGDEGRDRRDPD